MNIGIKTSIYFSGFIFFAVGGTSMTGCPGEEDTPDAGGEDDDSCDPDVGCRRSLDCSAGAVCEKEAGADGIDDCGICIKILCTTDVDCSGSEVCDVRRGLCVPDNLCDPGNPSLECEAGQYCVYVDGLPQCVEASELPAADTCEIAPAQIFVADSSSIELQAVAMLSSGALVPNATFSFSSDVGSVNGTSLTGACTGTSACTGTVTATSGEATCTAPVKVYPAVAENNLQIVLFDQTANAPVAGARAALKLDDASLVEVTTDADGVALFTNVTQGVLAASVFPEAHQWQTVIAPAMRHIAFFTVQIPNEERVAGVKGQFDFSDVSTQGDIQIGLAGLSISGSIVDFDFAQILGEIADYPIELEGVTNGEELVPLPSGLVINLGTTPVKSDFVTFGDPGKRILWALGGQVRLADIGPIISTVTASGDDINIGSILSSVLPFFSKFDHAAVAGLDITEQDRPTAPGENEPVDYAAWPFEELTGTSAVLLNTLLSQSANYTVPTLPCAPGKVDGTGCTDNAYQSGAILLSGVVVPGQGVVPLGLTAGLDDPDTQDNNDQVDGKLDYNTENPPAKGEAIVDYAPPHDGLEGNKYFTIAIALDIDALTEGGLAASTIVHMGDKFDPAGNSFSNDFLQQQGGTYTNGVGFNFESVGTADFYRLNLNDGLEEWNIYFTDAAQSDIDVQSLKPTDLTGRLEGIDIQAFKLGNGYQGAKPASFDDLLTFNGTNFDNFIYYMGAWVSSACEEQAEGSEAVPFCNRVTE
jgi:hypothetical protein